MVLRSMYALCKLSANPTSDTLWRTRVPLFISIFCNCIHSEGVSNFWTTQWNMFCTQPATVETLTVLLLWIDRYCYLLSLSQIEAVLCLQAFASVSAQSEKSIFWIELYYMHSNSAQHLSCFHKNQLTILVLNRSRFNTNWFRLPIFVLNHSRFNTNPFA